MQSSARNVAARNMALGQLITNAVFDQRILDAMVSTPREKCVPPSLAGAAYVDDELPLGHGRYLMAPLPFARLLAMADLQPSDRVLDVGCAYGYSTAVIARLAGHVVGCESSIEMATAAKRNLESFGIANAPVARVENLAQGYPADAPYDAIIIEGAIASVPAPLLRLLAPGGRLVTVERVAARDGAPGIAGGLGRLVAFVNHDGAVLRKTGAGANVPLLPGFEEPQGFVFS